MFASSGVVRGVGEAPGQFVLQQLDGLLPLSHARSELPDVGIQHIEQIILAPGPQHEAIDRR